MQAPPTPQPGHHHHHHHQRHHHHHHQHQDHHDHCHHYHHHDYDDQAVNHASNNEVFLQDWMTTTSCTVTVSLPDFSLIWKYFSF